MKRSRTIWSVASSVPRDHRDRRPEGRFGLEGVHPDGIRGPVDLFLANLDLLDLPAEAAEDLADIGGLLFEDGDQLDLRDSARILGDVGEDLFFQGFEDVRLASDGFHCVLLADGFVLCHTRILNYPLGL